MAAPGDDKDSKKGKAEEAGADPKADAAKKKETKADNKDKSAPPAVPPLVASGRRLERLLGGGGKPSSGIGGKHPPKAAAGQPAATSTSSGTVGLHLESFSLTSSVESTLHSNPPKIVRRWLGTSSGAGGKATLQDVVDAARVCLDPVGVARRGRELLDKLCPEVAKEQEEETKAKDMDVEGEEEKKEEEKVQPPQQQYLRAASREFESHLLGLAIRLLLREAAGGGEGGDGSAKKLAKAWELSTSSVSILRGHMEASAAATARAGAAGALGGGGGAAGVGGGSKGLEPLLARAYRYRCLVAEKMVGIVDGEALRSELSGAYRLACLRRDVDTQSTVLNLMLRDLLKADQVEQAQKLLANSTFPDSASNNQLCRYLYHSGRIQALRLEYTSAFSNLSQCLRKAPTNTGLGFRIAAQRLLVVVQLLMGEIPERNVFFTEGMTVELGPYMKITQAVRRGDLAVFHDTVSAFASRLREDGTYTLISRLAHSVVKAGLRKLNVSYSRISLEDVAHRLGLPSAESAEFVVAKAVRDGVIDATIDHAGRYVQSHDLVDVYATTEPAEAFHRRIAYCLTTHNDAVRGMRYPPDAYKRQLEASRGLRGKNDDDKTDEEKAAELEDELDEEY